MKKVGYFIYFIIVVILGFFFLTLGNQAAILEYYNTEGTKALKNSNYEDYIEAFMNYNHYHQYKTDLVYHGSSKNDDMPFNFMIMQSYLETDDINAVLNHFYFLDHLDSYDHLFSDQESVDLFHRNSKLAMFVLELYMEGEDEPTETPIEIHIEKDENGNFVSPYHKKVSSKPLALTYNYFENDEAFFRYITFETVFDKNGREERQVVWNEAKVIEKIEIHFADYTKTTSIEDEPIKTKILTINHDENANINEVDNFIDVDGVKVSSNFNGRIDNYINEENFTDFEEESANFSKVLKSYNSVRNKYIFIYVVASLVITYFIFFLRPTINYFKNKKHKKSLVNYKQKKQKTKGQIFNDDE